MYKKYIKRLLDIIFSLLGLIIASPIFLIVSLLVLIFLGHPIIFKQKRPGKDEKIFTLYKFRTMTNKKDSDGNLLPDEQRLTKFGKFLRKTSIDELPELFNILKGHMSFVGPRPMLIRDMVFFDDKVMHRQDVTPGLTGLAQVNGRNSINWHQRFEYDLKYIENISFILDLKIVFFTIKTVLTHKGIGDDDTDLSIDYGDYLLKHKIITNKEYAKKQEEANDLLNGIYDHKEKGLVSVITPSYNTGKYIGETIEGVLNQTYTNWEMIIVDDCSTDDTDKIVKEYLKDERIRYIKNTTNSGAAMSRNKALKVANGEWIAFLDSDDLWTSDKLEKQINFMKKNNYYFSYTNYEEIDESSHKINRLITGPKKITKHGMFNYCWPGCLTVMYSANRVGLIQIEDLPKNNDYAMWLKVIEKHNCYLLNVNLAKYRIRNGSISRVNKFKLIKHHYNLYRIGEKKSIVISLILTIINIVCGFYKKIKYVKKIGEE